MVSSGYDWVLHSFIYQIIIEYLLCARNFAVQIIFAIKKTGMDAVFMEFTVQLNDWQVNKQLFCFWHVPQVFYHCNLPGANSDSSDITSQLICSTSCPYWSGGLQWCVCKRKWKGHSSHYNILLPEPKTHQVLKEGGTRTGNTALQRVE